MQTSSTNTKAPILSAVCSYSKAKTQKANTFSKSSLSKGCPKGTETKRFSKSPSHSFISIVYIDFDMLVMN